MSHINPAVNMYREPRPLYDVFNAPRRANYNPNYSNMCDAAGHKGVDLYAASGTPAVASEAGVVHFAGTKLLNRSAGIHVEIYHPELHEFTRYLHLSDVLVKTGDVVSQGAEIGRVGCTGLCNSPHIHYEIRKYPAGQSYDPSKSGVRQGCPVSPLGEGILTNVPGEAPERPEEGRFPTVMRGDGGFPNNHHLRDMVRRLQYMLALEGIIDTGEKNFPSPSRKPDGLFGPSTDVAVRVWQERNGLPTTGVVDDPQWFMLFGAG